jgi:hypothetical protein
MNDVSLSYAQRANMNLLLLLREAAMRDLGGAVCSFAISKQELSALTSRAPDEILSFVCGMGDQALFSPRSDLSTLLSLPSAIAPSVAASRRRRQ